MIRLEVADYCQDCPEFEPECDKDTVRRLDYTDMRSKVCCFTRIYCKYTERCRAMEQYFSKLNDKR